MAYLEGCGDMTGPVTDCCPTIKTARISKIAFYKKPFIDTSDPIEWDAKIANGTAVAWKTVSGELPAAEMNEVAGYGEQETMISGTKSTITFKTAYDYLNNTAFRSLRAAKGWYVAYVFEGQPDLLWVPATQVTISGSPVIGAGLQDLAEVEIMVKWSNDEFPEYVPLPAGLFTCDT